MICVDPGIMPWTFPRRLDRSPMMSPKHSSGAETSTDMTGSRTTGRACATASLKTSRPATWKAMSFESTGCSLPSVMTALRSTTGCPAITPRSITERIPFSIDGQKLREMEPPKTSLENSNPPPRGRGSTRRWTSANWPAPPVCFLWRYIDSDLARIVSR